MNNFPETTTSSDGLTGLLADTWWFGLTNRLNRQQFEELAQLRKRQGFTAVQLVVGIPPEVGPENVNARSPVGFPWTRDGRFNQNYLGFARERIAYLNELGLTVIIYAAWGHQIDWLGPEQMAAWQSKIIDTLDTLQVIYCLSGESNLWIGKTSLLLPDKTTDDLVIIRSFLSRLHPRLRNILTRVRRRFGTKLFRKKLADRRRAWSFVLEQIAAKTDKPIIVHPTSGETGYQTVNNSNLLAANTAQTGHSQEARPRLWQLPLKLTTNDKSGRGYVNLEPWYEGIRSQFWVEDQLYAYWASMLAGARGHCYGGHGVWNVGDGQFLAHWGKQTLTEAMKLDTPRLLGLSHEQFTQRHPYRRETFYEAEGDKLITIGKKRGSKRIQFFPDIASADRIPDGKIWLPLAGKFVETAPTRGQVVIFCDGA
ncbi:MAG: DUF4038 domain-containing protein [Chloroflexi bacterium]|nr:DUF4038 domain-containing protein [Chloroflexota bacterium]